MFLKKFIGVCFIWLAVMTTVVYAEEIDMRQKSVASQTPRRSETKMTEAELNRLQQKSIKLIKHN